MECSTKMVAVKNSSTSYVLFDSKYSDRVDWSKGKSKFHEMENK